MESTVKLFDSYIVVKERKFEVSNGKANLSFSFSEDFGFTLDSFCNRQGVRDVEYVTSPQPFSPIKPSEKETEGEPKKEFLDNSAVYDKTAREFLETDEKWNFEGIDACKTQQGGVRILKVRASASKSDCRTTANLLVFPKTSVIRYWFDIENTTNEEASYAVRAAALNVAVDDADDTYDAVYLRGAHTEYQYGQMERQGLRKGADSHKISFGSEMNLDWVPLMAFEREEEPRDGVMIEMDCIMTWKVNVEKLRDEIAFTMDIKNGNDVCIAAKGLLSTPVITVATYAGDLDNLMVELYDWQYEYMWDYTNSDYFAKFRDQCTEYPWVWCSSILHEQFAYRLVCMDLLSTKLLMKAGIDISWDDAGWSSHPGWPYGKYMSVFRNTYEGPDHRLSTRYQTKTGLKRLLWFAKQPSLGLLGTKEGAWGEFEWRTDGIGTFEDIYSHWRFMNRVRDYLDGGLKRSFHTCHGGACYAFNFDIQRYGNFHYASDSGCGPQRTYYYSYFTVADRFGDLLPGMGGQHYANDGSNSWKRPYVPFRYNSDCSNAGLAMCGLTGANTEDTYMYIREDKEIYEYFREKGLVGRWSYMFHPSVYGDKEIYYQQRTSRDRLRACIIIRHTPAERVVVYPKGLIADEFYTVSFERCDVIFEKSGAELMEEGIVLKNVAQRELVYFNLTDSPARRKSANVPIVKNVVCCEECNVGMTGMGIYWSSEAKDVRYYEIARDGEIINTVARHNYYFDNECDLKDNPKYTVRAIGFADTVGEWITAKKLRSVLPLFSTLGSHGADMTKVNWTAEISSDLKTFEPMKWTPAAAFPGADFCGKPNQEGGIEGYFEGGLCAKIGRGWQQASPDCYCVRKFTVPYDGNITLTGKAVKEHYHNEYGSDVDICVIHGDKEIVPFVSLKCGDAEGICYNQTFDVKKGDEIRFVVGMCDPDKNDVIHFEQNANIIGWNTIIAYNGEKSETEDFSIRINCGGDDYIDQNGNLWSRDAYCICGENSSNTRMDGLFATSKTGDVEYRIPVPDGIYAVRLCFAETEFDYSNQRFMTVNINGSDVEKAMDIAHDVRGTSKAFAKVYRYVVNDENGEIRIALGNNAIINGIEIVPENDDIIHINCGGEDFVDWAGFVWNKDRYFAGGEAVAETCVNFKQATPTLYDKALYMSGRKGRDFSYEIPVKEGIYSVQLKFAELELDEENKRPIDIYINDVKVKENWDALAYSMEKQMSADIRFDDISSAKGKMTIRIVAKGENDAILRAIEIDS